MSIYWVFFFFKFIKCFYSNSVVILVVIDNIGGIYFLFVLFSLKVFKL